MLSVWLLQEYKGVSQKSLWSSGKVIFHLHCHVIMPILDLWMISKFCSACITQSRAFNGFIWNARAEESENHEIANAQWFASKIVSFSLLKLSFDDVKPSAYLVWDFLNLILRYCLCWREEWPYHSWLENVTECVHGPVCSIAFFCIHRIVAMLLSQQSHDSSSLVHLSSFVFPQWNLATR